MHAYMHTLTHIKHTVILSYFKLIYNSRLSCAITLNSSEQSATKKENEQQITEHAQTHFGSLQLSTM